MQVCIVIRKKLLEPPIFHGAHVTQPHVVTLRASSGTTHEECLTPRDTPCEAVLSTVRIDPQTCSITLTGFTLEFRLYKSSYNTYLAHSSEAKSD